MDGGGIAALLTYFSIAGDSAGDGDFRLGRILNYMDPWQDPTGKGWQTIQSLYAIGSGGLFGVGLGESKQKYLYVSEPQNDFIFSIIAEELGFICFVHLERNSYCNESTRYVWKSIGNRNYNTSYGTGGN